MPSKQSTRLCHLSDPHVGGRSGSLLILDQLVADAVARGVDHLLVTGDLVDRPTRENLLSAIAVFKRHRIWSRERCTLLPGNHDVSGLTVDLDFGANEEQRRRASAVFSRITAHVNRPHPESGPPLLHARPVVKRLGPLHLVSLVSPSLHDSMSGSLAAADLSALQAAFAGRKRGVRVVALHHNPLPVSDEWYLATGRRKTPGLQGGEELLRACAIAKVDLILHGHIHTSGRPVDRRMMGVNIRCQATARGELLGGRRRFGYDIYEISAAGWRRSRRYRDSAELVDGMLERPARRRPRSPQTGTGESW